MLLDLNKTSTPLPLLLQFHPHMLPPDPLPVDPNPSSCLLKMIYDRAKGQIYDRAEGHHLLSGSSGNDGATCLKQQVVHSMGSRPIPPRMSA